MVSKTLLPVAINIVILIRLLIFEGYCISRGGGIFVCPGYDLSITLFISITMSYGIDIILWNILVFRLNVRIFCQILSIPRNIVMDLNNVMS